MLDIQIEADAFGKKVTSGRLRQGGIDRDEIESVFADPNHIERPNKHLGEQRFEAIGLSNRNRLVIVIFTKRNGKTRYVTAWQQGR